jgi:hypothetical protein
MSIPGSAKIRKASQFQFREHPPRTALFRFSLAEFQVSRIVIFLLSSLLIPFATAD